MDMIRFSEQFHKLRESVDWKEFEVAFEKLIRSPACGEFQKSVAPTTGRMELEDLFNLLSGFVRLTKPLPPNTEFVELAYKQIYEYDDRPTMSLSEETASATILIGDRTYPVKIQLFDLERGSLRSRFGRAQLDGISRLGELNSGTEPTLHRLVMDSDPTRIAIPIVFFNVVIETDKYTGEQTTFSDFYILRRHLS